MGSEWHGNSGADAASEVTSVRDEATLALLPEFLANNESNTDKCISTTVPCPRDYEPQHVPIAMDTLH